MLNGIYRCATVVRKRNGRQVRLQGVGLYFQHAKGGLRYRSELGYCGIDPMSAHIEGPGSGRGLCVVLNARLSLSQ